MIAQDFARLRTRATVGALFLAWLPGLQAEIVYRDFSGYVDLEGRWFPEASALAGQGSSVFSFSAASTLFLEDAAGRSLTFTPFLRYDRDDPRRTHFDLREGYALFHGDVGDDLWELRVGVGRVFWGVTESQRLVDVLNQVDLVEHPAGDEKLGQPMAHLTRAGDWGTLELFALSYHRPRTFPGQAGRLRIEPVIDDDTILYESSAEQWHVDVAARYSHSFGRVDLGLSAFDGTNREPWLEWRADSAGLRLLQRYGQIRQFGLDAQLTAGGWLFKLEALQRSGDRNLLGVGESYAAAVAGGEYAFFSVFGSSIDVTLIAEWNYDARNERATPRRQPIAMQDDLFLAARLGFNDVQGTALTLSLLGDRDHSTRVVAAQFERRLSDQWSLQAEAFELLEIDPLDIIYPMRRDSFAQINVRYFF